MIIRSFENDHLLISLSVGEIFPSGENNWRRAQPARCLKSMPRHARLQGMRETLVCEISTFLNTLPCHTCNRECRAQQGAPSWCDLLKFRSFCGKSSLLSPTHCRSHSCCLFCSAKFNPAIQWQVAFQQTGPLEKASLRVSSCERIFIFGPTFQLNMVRID